MGNETESHLKKLSMTSTNYYARPTDYYTTTIMHKSLPPHLVT